MEKSNKKNTVPSYDTVWQIIDLYDAWEDNTGILLTFYQYVQRHWNPDWKADESNQELAPALHIENGVPQPSRHYINIQLADLVCDKLPISKSELVELINMFPQQRFGQLLCNYVCSDYRYTPSPTTQQIMECLFGDLKYDPFYEESADTLERLTKKYKS